MASLGHVALGLTTARLQVGREARGWERARWFLLYGALSMAPDLDVIGFRFHVRYADVWGHRGAAHSLVIAALLALGFALLARTAAPRRPFWMLLALAFFTVGSHGLLDSLTNGGLGVEFLWPWDTRRYFAAWDPIPVAPIGQRMLSARGLHVLGVEALLFAPFWLFALWPRRVRSPI